jgi:putative alpha-1,2-mannosidase
MFSHICCSGTDASHRFGLDAKGLGQTHLNFSLSLIGDVYESGALFSYAGLPKQVNIRVGVSFRSAQQACANAESEIGSSSFQSVLATAKALWQEKLGKIEIDIGNTPANITEMLYSSLYRSFLTPVRHFLHKYPNPSLQSPE